MKVAKGTLSRWVTGAEPIPEDRLAELEKLVSETLAGKGATRGNFSANPLALGQTSGQLAGSAVGEFNGFLLPADFRYFAPDAQGRLIEAIQERWRESRGRTEPAGSGAAGDDAPVVKEKGTSARE